MFTVAIFLFICFLKRNIYHRHRQHLNMEGQKIKPHKKRFIDISLSAKSLIYSDKNPENTNNFFTKSNNHLNCIKSECYHPKIK